MNDIESARIERRITEVRQTIKEAAKVGNGAMARAYAEELLLLLRRRDPLAVKREENRRGLL